MAQPLPYERDYDFQNFQSGHPSTPLPGDKVNAELDQVAATLDEVLARIALLQDDDTALKRGSVGYDQLAVGVSLGFEPPSAWLTATAYVARDTVFQGAGFYQCLVSHTSGTFATDMAAGKWELLADFTSATADAEAAQAAAEAAQALAEAARDSATASASSASSNAASASASANSASADAEQTAADRIATAADRVATAADRVQTGLDVVSSAASAAAAVASAASIVIGPGGVQEYSENLAGVAAVSPTDGNFIVGNGTTFTAENGATARASLGLGSAAGATLIDDDTMATATATNIPSAESVVAYVDNIFSALWRPVVGLLTYAEAWVALKLNGSLSTRALIKALTPQVGMSVLLTEAGRVGNFVWREGDYSAHIALDTAEGVYLKADSVAATSGAWVRDFEVLTAARFGTDPNATRAANAAAIQCAVNVAQAYVGELVIGEMYPTDTPITVSDTIRLVGRNSKVSGITCNNGHAVILATSNVVSNDNNWYGFRDLSLISTSGAPTSYGVYHAPTNSEYLAYWSMKGCYVSGLSGGGMFDCTGSTVGMFKTLFEGNWWNKGLTIKDGGDSITIRGDTMNGAGIGLLVLGLKTGARQLHVMDCNITALSECVYLLNATGVTIENTWMETPSYMGSYTGTTGALLYAQNCANLRAYRNTMQPLVADMISRGQTAADYDMRITGTSTRPIVDDNDMSQGNLGHCNIEVDDFEFGLRNRIDASAPVFNLLSTAPNTLRNFWAPPRCKATLSADQTGVASATWTKVTLNSESQDVGNYFDTTNKRWTPPKGRIGISAAARFSAGLQDQQTYACAIYKNGAIFKCGAFFHSSGTGVIDPTVMVYDDASGTDYYEMWCYGVSAGTLTLQGNAVFTWFEGQWLGPVN